MSYECCFDGMSRVRRADNTTIFLKDVQLGDRLASVDTWTGDLVYSDVYYVRTRWEPQHSGMKLFEIVVDEPGEARPRKLRLTWDHLVYVQRKDRPVMGAPLSSGLHERLAKDVQAGDVVWVLPENATAHHSTSGKHQPLEPRVVTLVHEIVRYSPLTSVHTLAGPVVVDGVMASSYEWSSTMRYLENLEIRLLYYTFPSVLKSGMYQRMCDFFDDYVFEPIHHALRHAFGWLGWGAYHDLRVEAVPVARSHLEAAGGGAGVGAGQPPSWVRQPGLQSEL